MFHKPGGARKATFAQRLRGRLRREFLQLWTRALPAAFRAQNVSFASVGERHHWLWDFPQLRSELEAAGFASVVRRDHQTSGIPDFPFDALDRDSAAGGPRKGKQSMFVEARAV